MASRDPLQARLLEAVELALGGDWQAAHAIVQEHEDHETANWIHAIAHRMEGDRENAAYWYGRVGRSQRPEIKDELLEIRAALSD